MWSFNRLKDAADIIQEQALWQGPLSWPSFENINKLTAIPDISGVYLLTFKYQDGYLLYSSGITNSTKRRFSTHTREYKKGNYNILNITSAEKGEREEVWHGWKYAKTHRDEFHLNKEKILKAVETQLQAFRVFVTHISDRRKRERIEAAIMENIYLQGTLV